MSLTSDQLRDIDSLIKRAWKRFEVLIILQKDTLRQHFNIVDNSNQNYHEADFEHTILLPLRQLLITHAENTQLFLDNLSAFAKAEPTFDENNEPKDNTAKIIDLLAHIIMYSINEEKINADNFEQKIAEFKIECDRSAKELTRQTHSRKTFCQKYREPNLHNLANHLIMDDEVNKTFSYLLPELANKTYIPIVKDITGLDTFHLYSIKALPLNQPTKGHPAISSEFETNMQDRKKDDKIIQHPFVLIIPTIVNDSHYIVTKYKVNPKSKKITIQCWDPVTDVNDETIKTRISAVVSACINATDDFKKYQFDISYIVANEQQPTNSTICGYLCIQEVLRDLSQERLINTLIPKDQDKKAKLQNILKLSPNINQNRIYNVSKINLEHPKIKTSIKVKHQTLVSPGKSVRKCPPSTNNNYINEVRNSIYTILLEAGFQIRPGDEIDYNWLFSHFKSSIADTTHEASSHSSQNGSQESNTNIASKNKHPKSDKNTKKPPRKSTADIEEMNYANNSQLPSNKIIDQRSKKRQNGKPPRQSMPIQKHTTHGEENISFSIQLPGENTQFLPTTSVVQQHISPPNESTIGAITPKTSPSKERGFQKNQTQTISKDIIVESINLWLTSFKKPISTPYLQHTTGKISISTKSIENETLKKNIAIPNIAIDYKTLSIEDKNIRTLLKTHGHYIITILYKKLYQEIEKSSNELSNHVSSTIKNIIMSNNSNVLTVNLSNKIINNNTTTEHTTEIPIDCSKITNSIILNASHEISNLLSNKKLSLMQNTENDFFGIADFIELTYEKIPKNFDSEFIIEYNDQKSNTRNKLNVVLGPLSKEVIDEIKKYLTEFKRLYSPNTHINYFFKLLEFETNIAELSILTKGRANTLNYLQSKRKELTQLYVQASPTDNVIFTLLDDIQDYFVSAKNRPVRRFLHPLLSGTDKSHYKIVAEIKEAAQDYLKAPENKKWDKFLILCKLLKQKEQTLGIGSDLRKKISSQSEALSKAITNCFITSIRKTTNSPNPFLLTAITQFLTFPQGTESSVINDRLRVVFGVNGLRKILKVIKNLYQTALRTLPKDYHDTKNDFNYNDELIAKFLEIIPKDKTLVQTINTYVNMHEIVKLIHAIHADNSNFQLLSKIISAEFIRTNRICNDHLLLIINHIKHLLEVNKHTLTIQNCSYIDTFLNVLSECTSNEKIKTIHSQFSKYFDNFLSQNSATLLASLPQEKMRLIIFFTMKI